MTIDEKIAEERELAQREKNRCTSPFGSAEAREHEELAEWLEELKAYRTLDKTNFSDGYNEAIDDFVNACKEDIMYKTFGLRECDIEQIAEQLKERGNK